MKFLIYSLKAKNCPSLLCEVKCFCFVKATTGLESGCLRVKEINTINKNRLMQVANHFRIIHTESINGQINMEKLLLKHLR